MEGFGLFDAFYMTVITISTVGFQEVHPLNAGGRLLTVGLIVTGIGGLFYTATSLAELIIDGQLREYARARRMTRRIHAMQNHVIVCSYGRTGRQVAAELAATGAAYVVIENNPSVLESLAQAGHPYLEGDAASDDILLRAGIRSARGLVSAVDSDQTNVYVVLTARSLNPDLFIVARASYQDSVAKLERAGANRVISPYQMAGHRMAEMVMRPVVVDVLDNVMHDPAIDLAVEELLVEAGSRAAGKLLKQSGILDQGARVLALRTPAGELHVSPSEDLGLEAGSLLVAIGTRDQLNSLATLL